MITRFPAKLRRLPQASWSIRVPCPGGSGACAGGAELESSESLSLLGGGGFCGLALATGATGGVDEMLETLMATGILMMMPDCREGEPTPGEINR